MKTIDFEIRTSELSASNKKLVGYAVRWNSLSEVIWDEFREQFAPGAFKDSLASGSDVRALYEHNYTQLLGRTLKESWDITPTPYIRTVTAAELREITVTSMPAYPESGVEIAHRSLFSQHPELRRAGDNRRRWADLAGL